MHRRHWPLVLLLFCTTFVGCVGVSGGGLRGLLFALITASLFAAACIQVASPKGEHLVEATVDSGTTKDQAGTWQACCESGKVSQCFCPAGVSCNYGLYSACGDGTCIEGRSASCEPSSEPDAIPDKTPDVARDFTPDAKPDVKPDAKPDAKPDVKPDQGGIWETVKEKQPDAGPDTPDAQPERKGTWERCCEKGKISQCFCPQGLACNYGWFTDCGNGTCTPSPQGSCEPIAEPKPEPVPEKRAEPIPEPKPEQKGTWQPCCKSGVPGQCFCPQGVACNYFYKDCGNGTCTSGAACP